ncbi:MAG: hypothetical protein HRU09_10945 [Oligoflexales bacterium]|nr:hypothetical protein [Oligoflexales bacterium]
MRIDNWPLVGFRKKSKSAFKNLRRSPETGSIALEYVLVSTFATVVGVALLGFAGHVLKQKVEHIMEKLSIDHEEIEFGLFED